MQQNTNEWMEWRKTKIGASDCPIIMGVSPWKTPYQLWRVKVGLDNYDPDNAAMARGRAMEDPAREAYEEKTGLTLFPQVLTSKEYDYITASFDGLTMDGKHAVEIKCPGMKDHSLAQKGVIPDKYFPQLQHQMYVGDLSSVDYWSFDGEQGVLLTLDRDDDFIKSMLEKEAAFYQCMISKDPPPLTEKDYEERHDDIWCDKEDKWVQAHYELKQAQDAEKRAREDLLTHAQGNTVGKAVKVTRYLMKGRVNYNKIPELIGVNLDEYRSKDSECWRVSACREV